MKQTKPIYKIILSLAAVCALAVIIMFFLDVGKTTGLVLTAFFLFLAIAFRGFPLLRGFSFTVIIFASVTIAMFYPSYFQEINGFDLKNLFNPLLQIIMFGMGTAMSIKDFAGVVKMPKGVFLGMFFQFTIMPFVGFGLANLLGVAPEIAAGIILIGASPSGLASNVMAYLAKANLALSVTLTAFATLLAPFITPNMMAWLGGEFVQVDVLGMMWSMVKIVVLPVTAGLVFNYFFHGKLKWLDDAMPIISMFGIAYIITIITAAGRDELLNVGLTLIVAGFFHNISGYFLGYWGARLSKMAERDCRTIALEVGMQNGGLASALANEMGKVATVGLAPAIFGPVMNITGSSLATYWRGKPVDEDDEQLKKGEREKTKLEHDKAAT
ncbi:bile acid:sodium symporter family protein [Catalinimonas niigatensis]|uniref:bile acid:sodium symporter family protein n=1 Tax=Catalinimonas niigatensis TaxID=1397264 RepID=UPI002666ADDF|nr:bile acid:sodium symporter family protein [Catalinimonas niigatensis]WPP50510.1 bile acid:sodium symporter family protein [Catalinimonas niigatensis]